MKAAYISQSWTEPRHQGLTAKAQRHRRGHQQPRRSADARKGTTGAPRPAWRTVALKGDPGRGCPRDAIGSVVFATAEACVTWARCRAAAVRLRIRSARALGPGTETTVSSLQVRWANGPTVNYKIDRVDTILTIDQASGSVTNVTTKQPQPGRRTGEPETRGTGEPGEPENPRTREPENLSVPASIAPWRATTTTTKSTS